MGMVWSGIRKGRGNIRHMFDADRRPGGAGGGVSRKNDYGGIILCVGELGLIRFGRLLLRE